MLSIISRRTAIIVFFRLRATIFNALRIVMSQRCHLDRLVFGILGYEIPHHVINAFLYPPPPILVVRKVTGQPGDSEGLVFGLSRVTDLFSDHYAASSNQLCKSVSL
jgi:hypothetical protein